MTQLILSSGLNLRVEMMTSFAQTLPYSYKTIKLTPPDLFKTCTYLEQFENQLQNIQQIIQGKNTQDLIFIGHSLSCLLFIECSRRFPKLFKRAIFFAPCFYPRFYSKWMTPLRWFPSSLMIPSLNLPEFRKRSFCLLSEYIEIVRLIDRNKDFRPPCPTLTVLSPHDELISYKKTQKWAQQQSKVKFHTLDENSQKPFHHMFFVPQLGFKTEKFVPQIQDFLAY